MRDQIGRGALRQGLLHHSDDATKGGSEDRGSGTIIICQVSEAYGSDIFIICKVYEAYAQTYRECTWSHEEDA